MGDGNCKLKISKLKISKLKIKGYKFSLSRIWILIQTFTA
jgi:hypothetical protein